MTEILLTDTFKLWDLDASIKKQPYYAISDIKLLVTFTISRFSNAIMNYDFPTIVNILELYDVTFSKMESVNCISYAVSIPMPYEDFV